jgi:two-component system cell cycle sensor histidine kinase PleC
MQDPERWIKARLDRHRAANGAILVHYEDRVLEVFEHRTHDGGCLMLRFDVTERERLGERLRQAKDAAEAANTAKSQFLANMSHELRTPLNAIIGFSQLLESELLGPLGNERYREYAGDIRDSGEHLLTIISDILDLSRVEAGRMVLEPVDTDIVELLRTGERWENERATLEGVELRLDVPERGLRWTVDPTRLKQAIVNLVSNAVKFTPRGGIVTLSAAEEGGRLVLRVTDTGVGMTAAQVHQALQPFGQVQNAMSRKHAGTGLGLPLTKALVELHGGTLEIDSRTGQGTVVEASIPARSAQKRQVSEAAA